ncbi:MAG: glycosyltransferase family 4 protein [Actinomycetota bacterium]
MKLIWTTRRSFPGPGGIPQMMREVAGPVHQDHAIRVFAARVDDVPVTRLNSSVRAQRFRTMWHDGIEINPLPHDAFSRAAGVGLGALSIPGARRLANAPLRALTAPPFTRALARGFRREFEGAELVHTWGGEHVNWAAGHAAKKLDLPLVVTPFAHPGQWGDDAQNAAFYRSADRVLALVPSEAAVYESLGVDADRIRVVGVPAPAMPEPAGDPRKAHGIGQRPLVLFLGVKEPYKGYRLVLQAMEGVWRAVPDARFAFIGPHTQTSEQDFSVVDDERVVVRGTVDRGELTAWLKQADTLILPSASEIFPVVILEAWSWSTPVVSGRWWCAEDVVSNGTDGLIIDPSVELVTGALITMLRDEAMRKAMGEAGRAKVEASFTPEVVARSHLDAYRQLLS